MSRHRYHAVVISVIPKCDFSLLYFSFGVYVILNFVGGEHAFSAAVSLVGCVVISRLTVSATEAVSNAEFGLRPKSCGVLNCTAVDHYLDRACITSTMVWCKTA